MEESLELRLSKLESSLLTLRESVSKQGDVLEGCDRVLSNIERLIEGDIKYRQKGVVEILSEQGEEIRERKESSQKCRGELDKVIADLGYEIRECKKGIGELGIEIKEIEEKSKERKADMWQWVAILISVVSIISQFLM